MEDYDTAIRKNNAFAYEITKISWREYAVAISGLRYCDYNSSQLSAPWLT